MREHKNTFDAAKAAKRETAPTSSHSVTTSRVLSNKRQTHERAPVVVLHRSTEIYTDDKGKITRIKSNTKVGPVTMSNGVTKTPNTLTRKQRAKATKAMMEARRAGK